MNGIICICEAINIYPGILDFSLYSSNLAFHMMYSAFELNKQGDKLEKDMATHSSILAWRIPGTGKPGGLPSMGSHRIGHD